MCALETELAIEHVAVAGIEGCIGANGVGKIEKEGLGVVPDIEGRLRSQVDDAIAGLNRARREVRRLPGVEIEIREHEFTASVEGFFEDARVHIGFFFEYVRESRTRRR